jgi:hypothetical protein
VIGLSLCGCCFTAKPTIDDDVNRSSDGTQSNPQQSKGNGKVHLKDKLFFILSIEDALDRVSIRKDILQQSDVYKTFFEEILKSRNPSQRRSTFYCRRCHFSSYRVKAFFQSLSYQRKLQEFVSNGWQTYKVS